VARGGRRSSSQTRVIGSLLGTVTGKSVEITNCFPVPHTETDEQVKQGHPMGVPGFGGPRTGG
jgi:hypothetical protein